MRLRFLILLALAAGLALVPAMPAPLRFAGVSLLIWALPGWGYRRLALAGEPASLVDDVAFAALAPWAVHGIVGPLIAPLAVTASALTSGVAAVGVGLALVLGPDRRRPSAGLTAERSTGFDRAVLVVAALLAGVVWVAAPYLELKSDIFAHVAAVKACLEEGRIFPLHEFYPAAQGTGVDPRFGAGHAYYAAWAALSGLTPLQAWHGTAALALFGFCLGSGSLVRATCESTPGRTLAFLVFLAAYGGATYDPLRVAPYPLWLGLGLLWLALGRVLRDSSDATWRTTLGAALLVAGSGGMHALAFLLGIGMLVVGRLVSGRRRRGWWTRAVLFTALAGLPVMAMRFWLSYGNVNPIHQKPWENLAWAPGWFSASPAYLVDWLWPLGVFGLLLVPILRRQATDRESVRFSTTLSVISLAWLVIPLLMTPSMKLLGFLPMRLILTILFPVLIGQWIDGRGLGPLRASTVLGGLAVAVLSLVLLSQRVAGVWRGDPDPLVRTPAWTELVSHLNEKVEPGAVILSDPYSMLAARAMAPQSIVAVPDGRSSPRDAHSVDRLRASWRALSASVDPEQTDAILAEYGVTHVLLNHRFDRPIISYEYPVMPSTFAEQSRKFVGNPDRFDVEWKGEDLVLLRVKPQGSWTNDYVRSCVQPRSEAQHRLPLAEGFVFLDPRLEPVHDRVLRLSGGLAWDGPGPAPFRHFVIRADLDPSPTPDWAQPFEKPYRKLLEKLKGAVYRQRWTRYPDCPTYVLDPSVQLPVSLDLTVPSSLEPGEYRVSVQVSDFSFFTVLRARDFLRDADAYSGPSPGGFTLPAATAIPTKASP